MSKDNASAFAHNYPSQNLDNSPKSLENYPIDFNHLKSHSIECDGGFFIPFKTLQVIPQICSTKTEILVFLCVLRFTAGFKRKSAVLSKSFISKWTGLDTGNVKRGVRGLLTKKIIQKRISTDKRTFEYEVSQIDGVNSTYESQKAPVILTPEYSVNQSNRPQFEGQGEPEKGVTQTPKIKVNKNKFNLTLENKALKNYFEKISDDQKFFPEQKSFEKLKARYSESEISKAYLYLQENGTVGKGARCPVPMSYLLKAIERVLELVEEKDLSKKKEKIIQSYQETQKALDERNHELLAKKRKLAEDAFCQNFPTESEQNDFVEEFFLRRFKSNYKPSMPSVRRMIAITDWYETNKPGLQPTSLAVNS